MASVWFYVPELDPVTPFRIDATGSFRGLPGSLLGTGPPGFSSVTPMMVIANLPLASTHDVRAIARLRLDFGDAPVPVPLGGPHALALLALLLGVVGCLRLPRRAARVHG
jgi:hypothetical protein